APLSPAGPGGDLAAGRADPPANLVVLLGREGAFAHPRGVGFADAEHVADRRRPQSRAGRGLGGNRVGGGHERIRAVVDIEQRALRAFEQDALALAALLVAPRPHRISVRPDARSDALAPF